MDLNRFLKPETVAIVGATEKDGFAGGTCRNIIKYSKNLDKVYFINPNRSSVSGKKCYDSLEDIEVNIDTVVIGTPKKTIPALLYQAKAKGAAGVVVYASGYSEVRTEDAIADEEELVNICHELDLCLMGPNCCGFANYIDNKYCWAIQHPDRNRRGKVGFVSQSGQICMSLMDSPNMTFSYCISCGNSKVVSEEEYIDFLIDDEDTKVVAIYMEGVNNPRKLESCFKKAALKRKPVIMLKAGRSERASAIAASHTGSMSGSDAAFDAIFKKYGIIRVDDMQELIGTSLLFADTRAFPDKRCNYAVICLSGGETAICADEGYRVGLKYADFEENTMEKLKGLLPFYASPKNNPLDITATPAYQPEVLAETLLAVLDDKNVDMVLLGFTLMDDIVDNSFYIMFDGIKLALEKTNKPFACLNFIEMSRNKDLVKRFTELGVPVLPCTKYAFECLKHLNEFVTYDPSTRVLDLAIPEKKFSRRKALGEYESKKMLMEAGIDLDLGKVAKTSDEAVDAAEQLGYPVAAKIESSQILHKSDVGGVMLNLNNAEEVKAGFNAIIDNMSANAKGAGYNGVLIQRMAKKGKELIIGVNSDPQFGPMILVGLGGIFVEVFKDVALYPAPLNKSEALEMIHSLRSEKLLTGYRGEESCDLDAIADVIVKVSNFAVCNKDKLFEMDINPLYVYPKGRKPAIIDALVIIDE